MRDYIIRRVLLLIPNLFILATLTFFLARVLPGDVALGLVAEDGSVIDQEAVQVIRERLGLNDPHAGPICSLDVAAVAGRPWEVGCE